MLYHQRKSKLRFTVGMHFYRQLNTIQIYLAPVQNVNLNISYTYTQTFGEVYRVQVVSNGLSFQSHTSDGGQTFKDSTAKISFASEHLYMCSSIHKR